MPTKSCFWALARAGQVRSGLVLDLSDYATYQDLVGSSDDNFRVADNPLTDGQPQLVRLAVENVESCTQHNGTRIETCQEESP